MTSKWTVGLRAMLRLPWVGIFAFLHFCIFELWTFAPLCSVREIDRIFVPAQVERNLSFCRRTHVQPFEGAQSWI